MAIIIYHRIAVPFGTRQDSAVLTHGKCKHRFTVLLVIIYNAYISHDKIIRVGSLKHIKI